MSKSAPAPKEAPKVPRKNWVRELSALKAQRNPTAIALRQAAAAAPPEPKGEKKK